ncbi:uncharacterized protein METZ01_LOCUS455483, partial [marine metagenome]
PPRGPEDSTLRIPVGSIMPYCWTWTTPLETCCTSATRHSMSPMVYAGLHRTSCPAASLPCGPTTRRTKSSTSLCRRRSPTTRPMSSPSPTPYSTGMRPTPSMSPEMN